MSVGRICVREVHIADKDDSIQAAAHRMHVARVGTLVVVNEAREPIGLVTDRDMVVRAVARGMDPNETTVEDIMTTSLRTVEESTPIDRALAMMRAGTCRRLPVVDRNGKLVGLLSVDDVLDLLAEEFNEIGKLLEQESPAAVEPV